MDKYTEFEEAISSLIDLYPLEELFEVLDITPERVLEILLEGGHVVLPEFLDRGAFNESTGMDDST
jgi:riboflavin biosynthesis pyrimidine reductase